MLLNDEQIAQAVQMIETQGMSQEQVARHFYVAASTVSRHLKMRGLKPVMMIDGIRVIKEGKIKRDEAMELYRQGWSDNQIAHHFGTDPTCFCLWRRKRGLPSNFPARGGWAARKKKLEEAGK